MLEGRRLRGRDVGGEKVEGRGGWRGEGLEEGMLEGRKLRGGDVGGDGEVGGEKVEGMGCCKGHCNAETIYLQDKTIRSLCLDKSI